MPDKINDKQLYELAVVLRPALEADDKSVRAKIAKIIADAKGEVATDAKFERRELAYRIKGETHGLYGFYRLNLPTDAPDKISTVLNITDEVLRYLLTKVDTKMEAILAAESERIAKHREYVENEKSNNIEANDKE